jgi:hypothetical protein
MTYNLKLHRTTEATNIRDFLNRCCFPHISITGASGKSRSVCATVGRPPHVSGTQESRPRPLYYNTSRIYDNISLTVENVKAACQKWSQLLYTTTHQLNKGHDSHCPSSRQCSERSADRLECRVYIGPLPVETMRAEIRTQPGWGISPIALSSNECAGPGDDRDTAMLGRAGGNSGGGGGWTRRSSNGRPSDALVGKRERRLAENQLRDSGWSFCRQSKKLSR